MSNKRIKVLMIGPNRSDKGGITTVVDQYYEAELDSKVKLTYLSSTIQRNRIIKIVYFIFSIIKALLIIPLYDIVHIHMSSRGSFERKKYYVYLSKVLEKEIVLHVHGSEFKKYYKIECNAYKQKQIVNVFNKASAVIALSEEWSNFFKEFCKKGKVFVMHNAVMVPKEIENKTQSQNRLLFLGRIGQRKGIYDILDIFPEVVKKFPDVILNFGGDGEIENCKEIIKNKNLQNNINYIGWVKGKKKEEYFKQSNIFLLPSYDEGMPMSLLEAMSYGLAVVASNVGGIPQVINDTNGIMIDAGDKDNLLNSILLLCENNKKCLEIGVAARKTILDLFNLEKNINILITLYNKLLF